MEPRLVPEPDAVPVTELLRRIGRGDAAAEGRLWRQIYPDLHRLAERYRRNERADHTLSPTALINEAYLHIVRQRDRTWRNRAHFVGVAALVMRRVLVDGGLALVAFHVGREIVHRDELFGAPVHLDFRFHEVVNVVQAMQSARLNVIECTEREPYPDVEYPSRRCYLLARAV